MLHFKRLGNCLGLCLVWLCLGGRGGAQQAPSPLLVTVDSTLPKTIYLVRGAPILFKGQFLPDSRVQSFFVRAGEEIVGKTEVDASFHFSLLWTPPDTLNHIGALALFAETTDRHTTQLANIILQILDTPPFRLTAKLLPAQPDSDSVEVEATQTGDISPLRYELLLDNKPLTTAFSKDEPHVALDVTGMAPGTHTLKLRATLPGRGQYTTDGAAFTLTRKVWFAPLAVDKVDLTLLDNVQDVPLDLQVASDVALTKAQILLDGSPIKGLEEVPLERHGDDPAAKVAFSPRTLTEGAHTLSIVLLKDGKVRYRSPDAPFTILPNLLTQLVNDANKYNSLLQDSAAARASARGYKPESPLFAQYTAQADNYDREASFLLHRIVTNPLFSEHGSYTETTVKVGGGGSTVLRLISIKR